MVGNAISPGERSLLSSKGGNYLALYAFSIPRWDQSVAETLKAYWRSRWFDLRSTPENYCYYGRRGSLLGNLLAFDIKKRLAEVLIEVDAEHLFVECRLLLDFRHQILTEWDILDYKLELVSFRCALDRRPLPEYFKKLRYTRGPSQAVWLLRGVMTGGLAESAPLRYHEELLNLSAGNLPFMHRAEEASHFTLG